MKISWQRLPCHDRVLSEAMNKIILPDGNECNIDIANDGNIFFYYFKYMLKRKMLYDFIFYDVNQNIIKGNEALYEIRKIENENNIHTKIIGIQNINQKNFGGNQNNDENNNINNNKYAPKSMQYEDNKNNRYNNNYHYRKKIMEDDE